MHAPWRSKCINNALTAPGGTVAQCMHASYMVPHDSDLPPGAVSALLMHLLRQGARLRNEAHLAHVAETEGSVETEEGRRGGSSHEQEPSPNLETLSQ